MAEHGGNSETLTLTIALLNIRNLRGLKGDNLQAIVRVEFGDKVLGESGKLECSAESPTEMNYNTQMTFSSDDPLALDDLACKPIVCTVVEVLPKEKKQKEEKTAVLGQCSVDLVPMLTGETKHKVKMAVLPATGSPMENLPPDHPKPELELELSVNEFKGVRLEETNIVNMTAESLYSPPESWNLSPGFNYVAATALPLGEKESIVVFTGGHIKPGFDKEVPNRHKKWAVPGGALGAATHIGDKTISSDPVEEENGDLKTAEDQEFRRAAEHERLHLTWNIERRCFLDNSSVKVLKERISKCRYLPVEVFRTVLPVPGRLKGKDDDSVNFHGVAYVDISPLLYPGVKRIRGAYKVTAFSEQELQEKTSRRTGLAEDAARIANSLLTRNTSPLSKPVGKKDDKGGAKMEKKPSRVSSIRKSGVIREHSMIREMSISKKPSSLKPVGEGPSETETQQPVNVEGMQYVDAKSYVMIEIELLKPLIPKKDSAELAINISELVPPRPQFPKKTNSAQKAVDDFHNQVGVVANLLLDEFRENFNDSICSYQSDSIEEKRQKLTYHLNASGKYLAFKEQLKYSVVKIVREKHLKTSNFQDKNELQAFLSELYVYLIDEMHIGLGKVLAVEDQRPIPAPLTDSIQLKHFAREAEVNENFELATKFYQERIARDKNDPEHWLDYGTFCLYLNDLTKAEECFRECLAIDQRHQNGLLLNGIVCSMLERNESAETFFEAAITYEPKSILAWTLFGLFYLGIGNEIGAEMAVAEAERLNVAAAVAASLPPSPPSPELPVVTEEDDKMESLERKMPESDASKVKQDEEKVEPSHEKNDRPKKTEKAAGESTEKKEDAKAIVALANKLSHRPSGHSATRPSSSQLLKLRRSTSGRKSGMSIVSTSARKSARGKGLDGALRSHATVMESEEALKPPPEPPIVPSQSIYMQCVEFLLDAKATPFTERALARHLVDPLGGPSSKYFVCLAQLKLQKHEMSEVEVHVKEAMQMDHQCPDAWAIMGHMKYLTGDTDGAKNCYERTLAFVADASEMHSIYLRLASIYLQEGQFRSARDTFLKACKRSPSCVSWLGVGIACYRLGDLADAEDALTEANILDNMDPEVWAYLCLVCLQTGRRLEAEQAYKYTVKLKLQDDDLMAEIQQLQEALGFGNPQF